MVNPIQPDSWPVFVDRLQGAVADLWYPSEADAPLKLVVWPEEPTDRVAVGDLLGCDATLVVECPSDQFFRPICANAFWRSPQGDHLAQRYEALRDLLSSALTNLRLYRVGTVEVALYLVGRHPSGTYGGLETRVVET